MAKLFAGAAVFATGSSVLLSQVADEPDAGTVTAPAPENGAPAMLANLFGQADAEAAIAAVGVTGCQSRSAKRPWGTLPSRTWTPLDTIPDRNVPGAAGTRTGSPFVARLVLAYGIDTEFSKRTAIFEFPDGCRRQYRTDSFQPADVTYIANQIAARPYPVDTATYATAVENEGQVTLAQIADGSVRTYETQHFNLMFGVNTNNYSYTYQAGRGVAWQDFLKIAGQTLEDGWAIDKAILGAPMPYQNAATKKKVNVYICGTGLPFIPDGDKGDCGASAAQAVYVSSLYLQPGSTTLWHEFGHAVQFYSGGFRDRGEAGPVWETNANFIEFMSSPHYDAGITWYYNNLENGPFWSVSRYGAFPIMMYLFENDATKQYVWAPWTKNLRNANGASQEDFGQALVRLGQAGGVFPNGYRSFADFMGWYGARMATGDFLNSKTLTDVRASDHIAKLYAPLKLSGKKLYVSSPERPLMQWGTHIVPLKPTANTMTVRLAGTTAEGSAAWRYFIVSVGANGTPRYSPMGTAAGMAGGDRISLPRVNGENSYLVVTATPYAYQVLGWQDMGKAPSGNKFPYKVTINGAKPLTSTACNSVPAGMQGRNLNYNTNGYTDQAKPCA